MFWVVIHVASKIHTRSILELKKNDKMTQYGMQVVCSGFNEIVRLKRETTSAKLSCVIKVEPNRHAIGQGAVHPASACNFQQAAALCRIQVASQSDGPFNFVNPFKGVYPIRISRIHRPVVTKTDVNVL